MNAKVMAYLATLELKIKNFLEEERGAVDVVAIVVLIGIAVLLALVFKDQLGGLIEGLFNTITGNATKAVNNPI